MNPFCKMIVNKKMQGFFFYSFCYIISGCAIVTRLEVLFVWPAAVESFVKQTNRIRLASRLQLIGFVCHFSCASLGVSIRYHDFCSISLLIKTILSFSFHQPFFLCFLLFNQTLQPVSFLQFISSSLLLLLSCLIK